MAEAQQEVNLPPSDNYDSETPGANDDGRERSRTFDLETMFGADIAVYLGVCFACSFVVMCQAAACMSQPQCLVTPMDYTVDGKVSYAVAVGVIGLFLACILFFIDRRGDSFNPKVKSFLAVFHFVWWATASWLTFTEPYDFPSASYFAIWLAVANSSLHALVASPDLDMLAGRAKGTYNVLSTGKKMTTVVVLASLVEMIAASVACSDDNKSCTKEYGYAVALGVISLFLSGAALFLAARLKPFVKFLSAFLVIWWGIGTMIVCGIFDTKGPFINAGNGFYASFAALAGSTALFANALSDTSPGLEGPDETAEATV